MRKLPLKPMKIYSAVREIRELSEDRARILITGSDLASVKSIYESLITGADPGQSVCLVDSMAGAEGQTLPPLTDIYAGEVIILVVSPAEVESETFNSRLAEAERAEAQIVVVLTEAPGIQVSFPGIGPSRVVGMAPGGVLPADVLAEAVVEAAGDAAVALASRLPALQEETCHQIIQRTARQNAVVGCLFIIPGADMPVMTLNEARMILRIAAVHGESIGAERAIELLGVIGSGFGFRAIARQLLDFMPGPGWVIKGGVGWTGTRALGEAARVYFNGSVRVTPSRFSPLVDKLKRLRG